MHSTAVHYAVFFQLLSNYVCPNKALQSPPKTTEGAAISVLSSSKKLWQVAFFDTISFVVTEGEIFGNNFWKLQVINCSMYLNLRFLNHNFSQVHQAWSHASEHLHTIYLILWYRDQWHMRIRTDITAPSVKVAKPSSLHNCCIHATTPPPPRKKKTLW